MPSEHNTPLVLCVARMADTMSLRAPAPEPTQAFLSRLLYVNASRDGGKEFWPCFVAGLITETELCSAVMDHAATWIADTNGVVQPGYGTFGSRDLELAFDLAFFGRPARPSDCNGGSLGRRCERPNCG